MNTNEHQFTPEEVEVYSAAIQEGLQDRFAGVTDEASMAAKIGTIRLDANKITARIEKAHAN
jgi:hypothetical protein